MDFSKRSTVFLFLCLLVSTSVLGEKSDQIIPSQSKPVQARLEPVSFDDQAKISTSGLSIFVNPTFVNGFLTTTLTWSPFDNSTTAILLLIDPVNPYSQSLSIPDTGSYIIIWDHFNTATYVITTLSNNFGNVSTVVAEFVPSGTLVTSPNASSNYYTNSQNVYVAWDPNNFGSLSPIATVNVSFVDQATQLNYTFLNLSNTGDATLDISIFNLPVSSYAINVLAWGTNPAYDGPAVLFGENSVTFSISVPIGNGINPGVYTANVNTSLSSGNSSDYIVYSATGLNVSIDNSGPILPSSDLLAAWTFAANLSSYNATLVLVGVSNASLVFSPVNVTDLGSASVSISSFGEPSPGFYELTVDGTLGSGVSLSFPIASASPLNITLSSNSPAVNSTINVTWTPFDILGNATISLLQLSDNTLIPVASNIADNGSLSILLDYAPGAYLVLVNTSIGNGSSSTLEIITTLSVAVTPSNISSASESTNVTWTPFDIYQANVSLVVSNGSNVVSTTSIPNTGSYPLTLSSAPGLYNVTVVSDIGSGSADLIVYSSTGLSVTSPNASSLLYSNTTNAPFAWSPSDPSTGNVTITLTDLNTNQTFNVTVPNTGSASVNLSALGLPPSSYQATIDSALGSGSSSDFVVKSPLALVVIQPNASTNVSDVGLLDVSWTPSNQAGSNATITLVDLSYPPTTYQFSSVDTGNATINLDTQVVSKDLFTAFVPSLATMPPARGTLAPRRIVKV